MLNDTIREDLVKALKNKDEVIVSTLRLLLSELHNAKITKSADLTDAEVIASVVKEAKKRRESIEVYDKAGRQELANKEKNELAVLENYLPKQLTEGELEKIVDDMISQTKASSMADVGIVMGSIMAKIAGLADGGAVSAIVRKKLAN